ncbi:response regulator [Planomonospora venezuelensis]|uniref:DNA-binding NarL/FixJ family response regulator n=1 Tax=Planomonospora venezuelensis TaxID=1999 RepID=A0A841DIQ0_PLAVE|nr:response regulator transcription factor [Planomonospora venezuelensis]MBB5967955.1 DNA-binding NarL/FixJ family response regulator [Planomonospora venezuelensis]GIN00386.1 DNA-binding response regulator [Planomonospora venezuelensis]
MTIRVLVADDQAMVREGFVVLLNAQPDIEVVGEAADGREAVAKAAELEPDVVLMDVRMPVLSGLEAARRLAGRAKVLVLTTFDLDEYVYEALRAGASGFLLKSATGRELSEAVRVVARGDALLAPSVTRRLIDAFSRLAPSPARTGLRIEQLTERESEILALVAHGLSNGEIADRLTIAEPTVKTHISNLLTKLRLRDRTQAAVYAFQTGLVRPNGRPPEPP